MPRYGNLALLTLFHKTKRKIKKSLQKGVMHHHFVVLTCGTYNVIYVWILNLHVQPKHKHGLANLLGVIHGICSKPITQIQTLSKIIIPHGQK
jgi:Fe2+ or Zn2+ uptake regulation protein